MSAIESMLSAFAPGRRVAIGQDSIASIRALSDSKKLSCPCCGELVVLKAGHVLSAHFAHLAGGNCAHPLSEPETEMHRAGKVMLAGWVEGQIPGARITLEAPIEATGQRADILVETEDSQRIAIEFQCADLTAREWRRRHRLYRSEDIRDLWLLGGHRLNVQRGWLTPADLERGMLRDCAPLLYFDPLGERLARGTVARFRPESSPNRRSPYGRLEGRLIDSLKFPWKLLDWPSLMEPRTLAAKPRKTEYEADARLWSWLRARYDVTAENLPPFFGISLPGAEALACSDRLWQACAYYRFVHGRVGEQWWLDEALVWARRYMPLAIGADKLLRRAFWNYQLLLSASGMLSNPTPRGQARVIADLLTLPKLPDSQSAWRIASYRKTLLWDRQTPDSTTETQRHRGYTEG